ncbi:MAG: radical SAM protein [Patescibacteria group bacterium]|jgi:MoaA/NifB/PqqE/SkfB family radical SAM enzyme
MQEGVAVQILVNLIHRLHDGSTNLNEAKQIAYEVFQNFEAIPNEVTFGMFFSVLIEYFLDPAKKAKEILQRKEITRDNLLASHRFISRSKLARMMFLSNRYPRSLLVKSAVNLLNFMLQNPQYLPKILRGEMVGPMMLEIHPTNAMCVYRCQMCIWCGGQKQNAPITNFYGAERLLTVNQWCGILDEAKSLGTKQIILSGGGETLLAQDKIRPVIDKANSLGLETMIYTNGRTLGDVNPALLDSILDSTWLRISLHAATPEIYSRLINRPLGANDLESVMDGIRKIVSRKKQRGGKLRVGIGIVLQELNYAEMAKVSDLCSDLGVDFLDVRVDCIGVTRKLSEHQYGHMLSSLRELRVSVESGQSEFKVSFADDLLIAMDQWQDMKLTRPKKCLIPIVRPAIDPFGIVGACDSIGEPYTRSKSPQEYILGQIDDNQSFTDIMRGSADKKLGVHCQFCMPGQISLNALLEKLVDDFGICIEPADQPFCFNVT